MPYEWFVALTRPQLFPDGRSRLSDPAYLDRFGFIPDLGSAGAVKLPHISTLSNQMRVCWTFTDANPARPHVCVVTGRLRSSR